MPLTQIAESPSHETLSPQKTGDPLAFEKAFDPWRRGTLSNTVLGVVRDARRAARELELDQIRVELGRIARRQREAAQLRFDYESDPEKRDTIEEELNFWGGLFQELRCPTEDLWQYLDLRRRWDKLTQTEQEAIRRRSRTGTATTPPMASRLPSQAQLDYLAALGYDGEEPPSMAAASEIINSIKTKRGMR